MEAQSQDVIQVGENTVNGKMADYIASTLKYDKLGIFISRVDTSDYPNITAYLNVNGKKEGRWSMASEFYADDFEIIDTQYKIEDFEMNSDASRMGQTSLLSLTPAAVWRALLWRTRKQLPGLRGGYGYGSAEDRCGILQL